MTPALQFRRSQGLPDFSARSETWHGSERQQRSWSIPSVHENVLPEQAREAPAHEHGDGS